MGKERQLGSGSFAAVETCSTARTFAGSQIGSAAEHKFGNALRNDSKMTLVLWMGLPHSRGYYFASSTGTSSGGPPAYILAESKNPATVRWNWTSLSVLFLKNQPWIPVEGAVKEP